MINFGKMKKFAGLVLALAALRVILAAPALGATFAGRVEMRVTGNYVSGDVSTAKDRIEETFSQLFTKGTGLRPGQSALAR